MASLDDSNPRLAALALAQTTALFFDVGGVVLTNGWDQATRHGAAEKFGLDPEELEDRHELVVHAWEMGQHYGRLRPPHRILPRTPFCSPRNSRPTCLPTPRYFPAE